MTTARAAARTTLARTHPVVAGAGAYGAVALVAHDVAALAVAGVGLGLVELVVHRRSRLARPGWRPSHVVELVLGAALVRRDGLVRPILSLVGYGVLAVVLGLLALDVVATAAGGLALVAGVVTGTLVAVWHHHEGRLAVQR